MYPDAKLEWSGGSGRDNQPFVVRTEVNGKSFFGKVNNNGLFTFFGIRKF